MQLYVYVCIVLYHIPQAAHDGYNSPNACNLYYLIIKHCHQFSIQLATARSESQVANIAQSQVLYNCHETLIESCILPDKQSGGASSDLLYYSLKDVLTEDIPLKFNKFIE